MDGKQDPGEIFHGKKVEGLHGISGKRSSKCIVNNMNVLYYTFYVYVSLFSYFRFVLAMNQTKAITVIHEFERK